MNYTCEIKRASTADVVVVGGGTAGVFAAIAAARTGARTVLIEKNNVLGGTMTVANVNYPGLFFAWGKQIIAGPCWESIERTVALGGATLPEITFHPEHHWDEQILLNRFVYTSVLFDMCEEAGVEVFCSTMLSDARECAEGMELLLTDKSGLWRMVAKVAIDATGDANLAVMGGFAVEKSAVQQPATLQNRLSGYRMEDVDLADFSEKYKQADLPSCATEQRLVSNLRKGRLNLHVACVDADTSEGRTRLERAAYADLMRAYRFLRSVRGLERLELSFVAGETGVRESNRIVGEATVTAEEYVEGLQYPDSVCYAFYPIDLHVMHGIEQTFHRENVVARVPYGALIPKGAFHLLCVGRCLSSDTYANSALRVEAVCMATGQAAGCAAALAARNGQAVGEVSYPELCDALRSIGAIVPEQG